MMKAMIFSIWVALISGCSTLINGTGQTVSIYPNNGQTVEVDIIQEGKQFSISAPAKLQVYAGEKQGPITVITKGPCVNTQSTLIRKQLAYSYWLNVTNIIGFFIDEATGAMWQYPDVEMFSVDWDYECLSNLTASRK